MRERSRASGFGDLRTPIIPRAVNARGAFTFIGAGNDEVWPLIGVFIIGSRHFIAHIAAGALEG